MSKLEKEKAINIKVGLDNKNHPKKIFWKSEDNPQGKEWTEAKGMLVSFFDAEYLDTYKLDLWTTDMQVAEMDRFVFQTIKGITDTYQKATGNSQLANDMQKFVQYFGEQTKILTRNDPQ